MAPQEYGRVNFLEKLKIIFTLCRLPIVPIVRLLLSPFRDYDRHKTWRRVMMDSVFRFSSSSLRVNQMQSFMGQTTDVYLAWTKKAKRPVLIDELDSDGRLLWFTDRITSGKIVYYLHGGVYQLPMQEYAPPFWLSNLKELETQTGESFGFVALQYTLYPGASFPTQLRQAIGGLSHLISVGIKPEDIHLIGESAGGGLVTQVLSHLLHPYKDIPPIALSSSLGSAFLMSPWVSMTTDAPSYTSNSDSDVLPGYSWAYFGSNILATLPEDGKPYVEAIKAPAGWWAGVENIVKKITIYTGEAECLRDDDVALGKTLKDYHGDVTTFVHEKGVHVDPYLSQSVGEREDARVVDLICIDILREASSEGAAFDSREQIHHRCFPGTRKQYIEKIMEWARAPEESNLLPMFWMRGPAGVGKLSVAQACAENLKTRLFTTVAYQLALIVPEYQILLNEIILRNKSIFGKTISSQFQSLIVEPFQELARKDKRLGRWAILIDGLDECKDKDAQVDILNIVASAAKSGSAPFCWAIFSREEPHIISTFESPDINPLCRRVLLPISREMDKEIELHLRGGFEHILRQRNLLSMSSSWPTLKETEQLVKEAAGFFPYSATILAFVDHHSWSNFKETLTSVLASSTIRSDSNNISPFTALDRVYTLAFERVPMDLPQICFSSGLGISELRFRSIYQHLQATLSYFTPPQLPPPEQIDLDRSCYSHLPLSDSLLTYMTMVHGVVSFRHKSFYDYLVDPARSFNFCVTTPAVQTYLFDRLVEQHHHHSSTLAMEGPSHLFDLSIHNSSRSLSWSHGTEFIDSCLKLYTFNTITYSLLDGYHTFFLALDDVPKSSLRKAVGLNYRSSRAASFLHNLSGRRKTKGKSSGQYKVGHGEKSMFFESYGVVQNREVQDVGRIMDATGGEGTSLQCCIELGSEPGMTQAVITNPTLNHLIFRFHPSVQICAGMSIFSGAHDFVINNNDCHNQNGFVGIDILREASSEGATFDSREQTHHRCFPGTRDQYITEIMEWARAPDNSNPSPMFWMRGPAGVGKSSVAQTCAEDLKKVGYLGAAFFFAVRRYDDHGRLFTTIAYQLSTIIPEYRILLDEVILRDKNVVRKNISSQFQSLIVEPFQELAKQNKISRKWAIFIDGLDECKDKDAQVEIVNIVAFAAKSGSTPFCWAIFSREEPHIISTFESPDINSLCRRVLLPISREMDKEIELHLRGGFEHILRRRNFLFMSSSWPAPEVIAQLVEAAAGLFAYSATILAFVDHRSWSNFKETLTSVLEFSTRRSDSNDISPFTALDRLYTLAFERVPMDLLPDMLCFLALLCGATSKGAYRWNVALVSNRLGISEIRFRSIYQHLQATLSYFTPPQLSPPEQVDVDRPCCEHLPLSDSLETYITGIHGLVSFRHKSFYDYLVNPARSFTFCVTTPAVQSYLIDRLAEQHHHHSSTLAIQGPGHHSSDLSTANSSSSLSWPHGTEFVDSWLKLHIFNTTAAQLLSFGHSESFISLEDIPQNSLRKLVDLDYRMHLRTTLILYKHVELSYDNFVVCASAKGLGRVIADSEFLCINSSSYHTFVLEKFLLLVDAMEQGGIIRPHHTQLGSSRAAFLLHNLSRKKTTGKGSGQYKIGHGEKSMVWYWEFDTQKRYFHEFRTLDFPKAMALYRTEKFKMWEESWVPPEGYD
ncbi:hypothetical protein NP233_g4709 [Leucocoprinus birnbaumii]|uniref:NACHT domain-containing protein n=1 Tax=Leucocoprinus birnbaumii TaxID=56174 RepID=A0AAD5YSK2_9AGAR|nr:hypothetical protein NP233_g4709 [Leucocoprinus birnbaumii]